MEAFGMAALFGLILGFMFGVGCAFAVLYTIYMGGYRKAVADSLTQLPSKRFGEAREKILSRAPVDAGQKEPTVTNVGNS
jgi:hypothetical protein